MSEAVEYSDALRGQMDYEYGAVTELVRQFLAGDIDRDRLAERVEISKRFVTERRASES